MAALSVPSDGLVLLRTPERGPASNSALPSQVIRLNLAQRATEEILKSFHNKEKISIRFGKRVSVQHGKKLQPVSAYPELCPSELYQCSLDDDSTFYFSGKLSHTLEAQKAQTDTAKADEALANLQNSLKSHEEQKASNEARIVTDKDELRHLTELSQKAKGNQSQPSAIRKDRFLNTTHRSTPTSPFLGAGGSPTNGPGPIARSVPASVSQDQIRLNAIKIPFLHLLAVDAITPKALAEAIHATKDDCEKLLHKYVKDARDANAKQELKDKAYRELDPWKFPYPRENDRQAAIDRAISAFDRMRINTSDQIWETLLPVKERGKGKGSELSRLKIAQAGLNVVAPKAGLSKGAPPSVTDTDTDHGKPAGKAKGSATKTKPRSDTNESLEKSSTLRKEATKQLKEVHGKDAPRKERRKAQANAKFKSSEVIEDSDEELAGVKTTIESTTKLKKGPDAKARSSTMKQPSKPTATTTTSSIPPTSSLKTSSQITSNLMPNSALTRPRPDSTTNKASPRPRTDSSPQKRSPLASSPPTNATDLDNSQSSKTNSLSSATSSPAMSPPHTKGQKPLPPSKTSEPRPTSTAQKRKAEDHPSPAPKRQQINGNHIKRPTINRINKPPAENKTNNRNNTSITTPSSSQRSRTPSSSSASTVNTTTTNASSSTTGTKHSPPSTSKLQSDLQLKSKSRRFKIQYARYQALHAKIMAMPEANRDAEEVKVLRKMHTRIGELKREIWEGWEKERGRDRKKN
ncbi:hypothetical protein EPUS_02351 [Endocarpon pusillum Z07020]|uniref:Uncharacterized protein n=1 Tax=Endocarpon pusillum (strain Z07020 / HMAS-L-300199) TaxID=1263415 RepID=U1HP53_ENDPU|nr:uncharacterized protein EPUS_02351 [Endocarpon pusillum Z07020]ERF70829.1 hypothetical protein EPUS_02351 [Endocarpon pusillum Z07020]